VTKPPTKPVTKPKSEELRLRAVNAAPVNPKGTHVLYWMTAARRTRWNRGLSRAVHHAKAMRKPLVVLEALRCGYHWANERIHRFVIDGMADNAVRFEAAGVAYVPYVESVPDAGKGLLEALAERACLVVTDDFPCFFLPRMTSAAGKRLKVKLEAVDGNGLLPIRATAQPFLTAHDFRRFLQRNLPTHLFVGTEAEPLAKLDLPRPPAALKEIADRWRPARKALLDGDADLLARVTVDHSVKPVATRGGSVAGEKAVAKFLKSGLKAYGDDRNDPDAHATSELSPYLHFGHVSSEEVAHTLLIQEGCIPSRDLVAAGDGSREGWWHVRPSVEGFLDQLVTWRELGLNLCVHRPRDYDRYESLPDWARASLDAHARDPRPQVYGLAELEAAKTHDEVWNAAQRQLLTEGRMQNYLRMLWGKKVLQWAKSPRDALDILIHLNNKYALDGRDPNSYSGIFWTLGRYDRPWAPRRPIFGVIRYMSSENTVKKLRMKDYLARYGAGPVQGTLGLS